ncbi:MAG: metal ABC transporter substrate-binding protein [Synechococcus sp.]|nr:metal ABC transporter substrate-binding protein [Synechococcus sp.]
MAGAAALLVAGGLALTGCSGSTPPGARPALQSPAATSGRRIRLVVLSEAHRTLASRIGGHCVVVDLLPSDPGGNPELPPPRAALLAMQNADRILLNGEFQEPWLDKVSLPQEKVVELSAGWDDHHHGAPEGSVHRHGPTGAPHSHGAPTLPWLDLDVAMHQVEKLRDALQAAVPAEAAAFHQRADALLADLGALDRAYDAIASKLSSRSILTAGGELSAFRHRYAPGAHQLRERPGGEAELFLQEIDRQPHSRGALLLLSQPLPKPLLEPLRSRGVTPVVLKTGRSTGGAGDYLAQLHSNASTLNHALASTGAAQPR